MYSESQSPDIHHNFATVGSLGIIIRIDHYRLITEKKTEGHPDHLLVTLGWKCRASRKLWDASQRNHHQLTLFLSQPLQP